MQGVSFPRDARFVSEDVDLLLAQLAGSPSEAPDEPPEDVVDAAGLPPLHVHLTETCLTAQMARLNAIALVAQTEPGNEMISWVALAACLTGHDAIESRCPVRMRKVTDDISRTVADLSRLLR
jgi:hypothetical protein